jgi:hypothetical protein
MTATAQPDEKRLFIKEPEVEPERVEPQRSLLRDLL